MANRTPLTPKRHACPCEVPNRFEDGIACGGCFDLGHHHRETCDNCKMKDVDLFLLPKKTTVAWCREHGYIEKEHIGESCMCFEYCGRKLIKRVGYIAEDTEGRTIYFNAKSYRQRHDE